MELAQHHHRSEVLQIENAVQHGEDYHEGTQRLVSEDVED